MSPSYHQKPPLPPNEDYALPPRFDDNPFPPFRSYANGIHMPVISFSTGTTLFQRECVDQIVSALRLGYRSIDTCEAYGNLECLRVALSIWGGKRTDVFIKVLYGSPAPAINNPRDELNRVLNKLDTSYIDMYVIQAPQCTRPLTLEDNWRVMEQLQREGLCRSLGVSNHRAEDIEHLAKHWIVPPVINQIELHPYVAHSDKVRRAIKACSQYNISIEAYNSLCPITQCPGGPLDAVVADIASQRGATSSQVLVAWAAQVTGGHVVTTGERPEWQLQLLRAFSRMEPLSKSDIAAISVIGSSVFHRQYQATFGPDP